MDGSLSGEGDCIYTRDCKYAASSLLLTVSELTHGVLILSTVVEFEK